MKIQKIAIFSFVAVILILISFVSFQTIIEESNFETEVESNSHQKENMISIFHEKEEIITTFQQVDNLWKLTSDGVVTFDTEDYVVGKQSLKITTDGNGNPEIFRLTNISPPIDFTEKFLKAWGKISYRNAVEILRINISSDNFENYKTYWIHQRPSSPTAKSFQTNVWNPITISNTQTTDKGITDISKINSIEIVAKDRGNRPFTFWLNSLSLLENNDKAIVSFTFDDAVGTQFTNAVPILAEYNYSATTYIPTGWVGKSNRLSIDQLKVMQDKYGWDISSHTVNHVDVSKINNEKRLEGELVNSKQFLLNNGFEKGSEHFAYPFGSFNSELSIDLIKKHYKTARIVRGDIETLPVADPYRIRVIYVLSITPPDLVLDRIDRAIDNGDWAILVFHGIVDNNAYDIQGTYLKSNFQVIVDGINKKGVDVMTVSEVYNNFFEKKM